MIVGDISQGAATPRGASGYPANHEGCEQLLLPSFDQGMGGERMRSRGRQLLSLLVALAMTFVFVMPVFAQTPGGCTNVDVRGDWTVIDVPKSGAITAHAVDPLTPETIYATDGSVVGVSTDGGCEWKRPYPTAPANTLPTAITDIDAPTLDTAIVATHRGNALAGVPGIAYTVDSGATWTEGGVGLPPTGTIEFLESPGDLPRPLFAGVDEGSGAADLLYVSTDNGATWTLQSDLTKLTPQMNVIGLTGDPTDPTQLFAYGPGGLWRSEDGGESFASVSKLAGENVLDVAVIHPSGAPKSNVMAILGGKAQAQLSTDGGEDFNIQHLPGPGQSIDRGNSEWDFLLTAGGNTYVYLRPIRSFVDLNAPMAATEDVAGNRALPNLGLSVHNDDQIGLYRQGGFLPRGYDPTGVNVPVNQNNDLAARHATFGPPGKKIYLKAGESKTVPYVLSIPPVRVPLDVYFLVDTSSSMKNTIDSLAKRLGDITNALLAEKIDVQFGLAVYRSYPDTFPPRRECGPGESSTAALPCERNYIYEQILDISKDTGPLADGLSNLIADAGGSYDAHLDALKGTVSGQPVDLAPRGVENNYDVQAGEQAKFREKSVRVVIHASDEAFGRPDSNGNTDPVGGGNGPEPDFPDEEEIIRMFNANDVEHVGLSVGRLPYKDMVHFSRETETFASQDIDCDQNGVVDVSAGEPLVCKLFQEDLASEIPNIVPAVTNLLSSIKDRTDVTLVAKRDGHEIEEGQEVIQDISPNVYPDRILQTAHELPFDVTYACSKSQAGERFPVSISPFSEGAESLSNLSVDATVVCLKEKEEDEPPYLATFLPIPLAAIALPPPVPPPPAPVTQSNPATQAQAQGQAQAAAATQEEEQPQLAFVAADEGLAIDQEYAMSAYDSRRRGLHPGAALGLGALSVTAMYGTGLALRRRTRVERARY
jgi:hypothetical protein